MNSKAAQDIQRSFRGLKGRQTFNDELNLQRKRERIAFFNVMASKIQKVYVSITNRNGNFIGGEVTLPEKCTISTNGRNIFGILQELAILLSKR